MPQILKSANIAQQYSDSKIFVDKPINKAPGQVLAGVTTLTEQTSLKALSVNSSTRT